MDSGDRATTGLVAAGILVLIAWLIAGGVASDGGRGAANHYEPRPAGVVELSDQDYLVKHSVLTPGQLCRDSDANNVSYYTVTNVPQLRDTLFISCAVNQTWSDHHKRSINYGQGLARAGSSLPFIVGAPALLLLCLSPAAVALLGERKRRRARAARDAELRKQEQDAQEVKRASLAAAWARDEITDQQYEKGLERILRGQ